MPPQIILNLGMRSEDVAKLQLALRQLDFPIEGGEGNLSTFGRSTREAVLKFQRQYQLEPTGVADERTVDLINDMVAGKGRPVWFIVRGYVREVDGTPFADGCIRVYNQGLRATRVPVGEATTNREGYYKVFYNPQDLGKSRINLRVEAVSDAGEVISLPHDLVYRAGRDETLDLTIDQQFTVTNLT